ncbi:lytic polysaccharide monooxygenase [Sodalis sp. RH22]|uniref:lytic polysaccharide monooxygenase n=1 Tax=unclassified Sodalis (in: enterobacteria) TaxID=2636512 RepID=UPI0039B4B492
MYHKAKTVDPPKKNSNIKCFYRVNHIGNGHRLFNPPYAHCQRDKIQRAECPLCSGESNVDYGARLGRLTVPPSRAQFLANQGYLEVWFAEAITGGKNFPDRFPGPVRQPFQDDVESSTPPSDFYILSGGHQDRRGLVSLDDQDMTFYLGIPFTWPRIRVNRGQELYVEWLYYVLRATRGYRAFITKDDWSQRWPYSRDQFEPVPFWEMLNPQTPYWQHAAALKPKDNMLIPLPWNKSGYHVILLLWLTTDTYYAVYQALDVDFG